MYFFVLCRQLPSCVSITLLWKYNVYFALGVFSYEKMGFPFHGYYSVLFFIVWHTHTVIQNETEISEPVYLPPASISTRVVIPSMQNIRNQIQLRVLLQTLTFAKPNLGDTWHKFVSYVECLSAAFVGWKKRCNNRHVDVSVFRAPDSHLCSNYSCKLNHCCTFYRF